MKNKKRSKKKTIIISMVSVAAVVGGTIYYNSTVSSADNATAKQTASVEKRDLQQSVTLSGTVQSAEVSNLRSNIAEVKVVEVKVKVGDRVKKGDIIAMLDDTELQNQLAEAEKELENAKILSEIDVQSAQRLYDNAVSGKDTMSSRSTKYVNEAKSELDSAIGKKNSANSSYNSAVDSRASLEKQSSLADDEAREAAEKAGKKEGELAVAQADLDSAQTAYEQACAALEAIPDDPSIPEDDEEREAVEKEIEELNKQREEAQAKIDDANGKLAEASSKLEDAQGALIEAKTEANAKAEYASQLKESIGLAKQSEAEAKIAKESAEANVKSLESALDKASDDRSDTDTKFSNDILDTKDRLTSTQMNADQNLDIPQQKINKINEQIEECVIRADIDGVVTAVNVKEGQIYHGEDIAAVQDDSAFIVSTSADQYDVYSISNGMETDITVQAIKADLDGEVSFVAPTPTVSDMGEEYSSTSYTIEIDIKQPDDKLRIGMTAKALIVMDEKTGVLCVPDNVIHRTADGETYVMITQDGQNEEKIPVICGFESDYYTEISGEGISEGVKVVVPSVEKDEMPLFY